MQINPDYNTAAFTIRSYEAGEVTIFKPITAADSEIRQIQQDNAQQRGNVESVKLKKPFIITPREIVENWDAESPNELHKGHFEELLTFKPEIIILGTGNELHFPDIKEYMFLQQQGIGVEVMGTAAACRTYNFLVSDGRNIAAGLFMI